MHLNNLLMVIAVFVFGMSATTGRLRGKMRHPQLTAVKIWAVAHLLVNGDLASIILFGGMLAWAVVIGDPDQPGRAAWVRPEPGAGQEGYRAGRDHGGDVRGDRRDPRLAWRLAFPGVSR